MRHFLLLTTILLLFSCASPMQTLKKGNYDRAYKQALAQLKKDKSVKENEKVLSRSLTKIIARDSREKNILVKSDNTDNLLKALEINEELQEKIAKALPYVGHTFDADYDNLRTEENDLKEALAYAFFSFGKEDFAKATAQRNKQYARDAYYHFLRSREYGYSGAEIDELQNKSLTYGQLVYTVEADESFGISYDWEIDRLFENVEDYGDTFRKIYYERLNVENVDCHLDISFNSLDVNFYEDSDRENYSRRVQTGTETVTDENGVVSEVPVYEDVSAIVIKRTITKEAYWEVRVSVSSLSRNCDLDDNRFDERLRSQIEEIQFEGDERALPSRYRGASGDRLMDDDDMAEELMERLYREILRYYF